MARCTAKSKRTGHQCKKDAVIGRNTCHIHGGKTLQGAESPLTKTGRYSKYLPERLQGRYQEAQADGDLILLRDEIALIDSRITELLGKLDLGESNAAWQTLRDEWRRYKKAIAEGDVDFASLALLNVGHAIENNEDGAIWSEIYAVVNQRKLLVESERKRLVEMQQMITAERAYLLVSSLVDIVRQHVDDRTIMAAIAADARKLVAA